MLKVKYVELNSIAQKHGIKSGDTIISLNNRQIFYDLDFAFHEQVKKLKLVIKRNTGLQTIRISKEKYEQIGLIFDIPVNTCKNKCIFCFIDQMPKDIRPSLLVKDEDIRQSFLNGSYITMSDMDIDTIKYLKKYSIHPIYISIHATEQKYRDLILGRKEKDPILVKLSMLKKSRLYYHGQIVIIPGINDGTILEKSLEDLSSFYPYMQSLALVPVGLTKFRHDLYKIADFTEQELKSIGTITKKWQKYFLQKYKTRFVFLADEFFIKSGEDIPGGSYYEDYSQIENGVGLVREFIDDFNKRIYSLSRSTASNRYNADKQSPLIITGMGFYNVLRQLIKKWNIRFSDNVTVQGIVNEFFGDSVNVSGLLCFSDIKPVLEQNKGALIIVPDIIFNQEGFTIDNYSKYDMETKYKELKIIKSDAGALIKILHNIRINAFAKRQNIGTAQQKAPKARRANTDE